MPKELTGRVQKLEDVPEPFRDYFKKEVIDGKETGYLIINIPEKDGYAYENVMGLKSGLSSEREGNEGLRNKLNGFKDESGNLLDPEKVRGDLAELKKLREGAPDSEKEKSKWEAKERELTAAWQKKFDDQKGQIDSLDAENRTLLVTHNARAALARALVEPEWEEMMLGHLEKVMKVKDGKDGKRVVRLIGSEGIELPSMKPGSTAPMDLDEYVKRNLVSKYDSAFKAPDASGSGAPGGEKDEAGGPAGTHQISREDARDPVKYQQQKAAAAKAGVELEIVE